MSYVFDSQCVCGSGEGWESVRDENLALPTDRTVTVIPRHESTEDFQYMSVCTTGTRTIKLQHVNHRDSKIQNPQGVLTGEPLNNISQRSNRDSNMQTKRNPHVQTCNFTILFLHVHKLVINAVSNISLSTKLLNSQNCQVPTTQIQKATLKFLLTQLGDL